MASYRVMIVDDSAIMSQKLTAMLQGLGHEVVKACRNAAEAIASYPEVKPDLVTMDIIMPDMDGVQATKAILACDPKARILMVTSVGLNRVVVEALDAGAKEFTLKPVKANKLGPLIEKMMA